MKTTYLVMIISVVGCVNLVADMDLGASEFYFVRHGQTDHNAGLLPKEVYGDIPLNTVGLQQAEQLRSFVEILPIKTICCSPLLRARQTKDVINKRFKLPVVIISDLREGSHQDWCEIQSIKNKHNVSVSKSFTEFESRLQSGLKKALRQPGPVLIVAHGGVYSALCRILNIDANIWAIANCTVVHFYKNTKGAWQVKQIFDVGTGSRYDANYDFSMDCLKTAYGKA